MRRSIGACLRAVALASMACAHPVPPSGGPEDRSPPDVVATSPALFETNVPLDARLAIVFSERMDRGSVEDGLLVRPYRDLSASEWRGDTLSIVPSEGWSPTTTYTVLLKQTVKDIRDNRLAESSFLVFSTGDSIASGQLAGQVERIGVGSAPVLVLAFAAPSADTTAIDPLGAVSVAEPDEEGRFLLPGLETGREYEIGAFLDVNENRSFDGDRDLYCRAVAPVAPSPDGGPQDIEIALVFADEPGSVQGVTVDSTCVGFAARRLAASARADSLGAERDSLRAFRDSLVARADRASAVPAEAVPESLRVNADSLRAAAAAIAIPDSSGIVAALALGEGDRADSVYCSLPIVARFWKADLPESVRVETSYGGAFGLAQLAPGTYAGLVWRDLDADGRYAPPQEPGVAETLRVYVPPGRPATIDTLALVRPEGWHRPPD